MENFFSTSYFGNIDARRLRIKVFDSVMQVQKSITTLFKNTTNACK